MRWQAVSMCAEAGKLSRGLRAVIALTTILLAGCFEEGDERKQAVRSAGGLPPIFIVIDRSMKSDRLPLPVQAPPSAPSLAEARAAALKAIPQDLPLASFYRALSALQWGLRREPVTVLHLGDSHIAADRFSGTLRTLFQTRFGDAGRGMMMPGFPFPYYRANGVGFAREGTWRVANSFKNDPGPYGLSGVRLTARRTGARLTLTSEEGAFEWAEVSFAAQPDGGEATVTFGGAQQNVETAGRAGEAKRVRIERKGRELSVVTNAETPVSILSWSVGQNRPGLRYVNFGIPGATADTPRRWDEAIVADDLARLKPDLIVLGYGTNEGFNDDLDMPAYEAGVSGLLARLKARAPQASVLVLGPPDSARFPRRLRPKDGDAAMAAPCRALSGAERREYVALLKAGSSRLARWHAPPRLADVRASLERAAQAGGAYFWDWSGVMGGPCGIHEWASAEPPLAASDHVHLRSAGAERSARALFNEVMRGYETHQRLASR